MDPETETPDSDETCPTCSCAHGPRRTWWAVFLGMLLILVALALGLSWQQVLIVGLIPLAVLVAVLVTAALSGRK